MISHRQADLKERLRSREIKVGDKVRVKPSRLDDLGSNAPHYAKNRGIVNNLFYSGYYQSADVKWAEKINTQDNCSTIGVKFLELA